MKKRKKHQKLRNAEYYDLLKQYDALYQSSKQNKIFTKLMDIISSEDNVKLAYRNIKRNKGSHAKGVDGLNIDNIESLSASEVIKTIQKKFKYYKPSPVKRVEIPKPNGELRPLGIPTIYDRLIQQCILQVLEPNWYT